MVAYFESGLRKSLTKTVPHSRQPAFRASLYLPKYQHNYCAPLVNGSGPRQLQDSGKTPDSKSAGSLEQRWIVVQAAAINNAGQLRGVRIKYLRRGILKHGAYRIS
ncbi:hypothetical protein RRG08_018656 [Elysia crispata]|uniref:Uncharacterized protein n=1 Tax=Elysia crispata TaxID=231223 RepID=A0AAE0XYC4_9GAST|nr:hypothetical protein RRG08_018656 [Elysia crispata]